MQATPTDDAVQLPEDAHLVQVRKEPGVARIEALFRVFNGRRNRWLVYACIGLVFYVSSLQINTTASFLVLATSSYGHHSLLGAITVANSILAAVSTPVIAKFSDATSRPRTYAFSLIFYVIGYTLVAASRNVETLAAGQLFANIGDKGISLVNTIIVADITPLKWRAMGFAFMSTPFIVNAFISAPIAQSILSQGPDSWRLGYAIFVIVLPVAFAPALVILFWAEMKAKKQDAIAFDNSVVKRDSSGLIASLRTHLVAMDLLGLLLLGGAFALLLLPLTVHDQFDGGWKNKGIIAMFMLGAMLLGAFAVWELKFCKNPLMSRQILNKTLILAIVIDFFYFLGGFIRGLYFSSWVWVVKDFNYGEWTLFNNIMGIGLCVFCLVAGAAIRYLKRYKPVQLAGLAIFVLGHVIILYCRHPNPPTAALVAAQIIISAGGACNVVGSQVAAQASVKHEDMASVIAILSLWTTLGGSIGSAISTAIWTSGLPVALEKHLPNLSAEERALIFGSIDVARGSEPAIRAGVIDAYVETVKPMWIASAVISIIPFIGTIFMTNYHLGDTHNAVEDTLVNGVRAKHARATESSDDDELDSPSSPRSIRLRTNHGVHATSGERAPLLSEST